jgi:hypothetical protein
VQTKVRLNYKAKKLLLLQRNELLTEKQNFLRKKYGRFLFTNFLIHYFQNKNIEKICEELFRNEISTIEKFLPKNIKNIMDVGCGLGIINIFLNEVYRKKPNFYLLDKNRIDSKIKYGFSSNYESYNDLNETRKILLDNGLENSKINIFDVDEKINIEKKIDLVLSLKSMGYHYPFKNYISLFAKCCTEDTIFIFDIFSNQYEVSFFKKYFDYVEVIYSEESIHPLKRLCCKAFKS